MQTVQVTHVTTSHRRERNMHLALPKGAQPPQIRPRDDLPLDFDAPKRKNVLRKTSKSSSSTTVTSTASSTASSSSHNYNLEFLSPTGLQNTPLEPGRDPLLDRLRYDLSYPPPQKPLPTSNHEDRFGVNNTRIQSSWSDSGHLTRQNTFSALFVSPSSSSSSSETGHHDSAYHSQIHFRAHPRPSPQENPMPPLSYHMPSRRLNLSHSRSTASSNDLHSSVSHPTKPELHRRPSSFLWLKRSLGMLCDKEKQTRDPQHEVKSATSAVVVVEPKRRSRRFRNESNAIAFSSSVSESGHVFVIPTEEMDTSPSRSQRKLKKRPPSAWSPIRTGQQTSSSSHLSSSRASVITQPVNHQRQRLPNPHPPSHASSVRSGLSSIDEPQDGSNYNYRHSVHDPVKASSHQLEYHQHYPPFQANVHPRLNGEHTNSISLNSPTISSPRDTSDSLSPVALPPLRVQSPLRIHIPPPSRSISTSPLPETARSKSEPDLTGKAPGERSRRFADAMHLSSYPYRTSDGHDSEPATQSPVNLSPTAESSVQGHTQFLPVPIPASHTRPSFLRTPSNRRWTLAVSEAPEDELVEELERLRRVGWALGFQGELVKVKSEEDDAEDTISASGDGTNTQQGSNKTPLRVNWRKEEMEQWLSARKALLVCREIVRTEKTYREGLETLQRGETLDVPSPLLLQYLPALISASQAFSTSLQEDPSAWGVSVAFLSNEEALEAAFVAWSGIAGEFFQRALPVNDHVRVPERKTGRRRISLGFDRIAQSHNSARSVTESPKKETERERERERRAEKAQAQPQSQLPEELTPLSTRLGRNTSTLLSSTQAALWRRSMPSLALALIHGQSSDNTAEIIAETNGSNTKPDGSAVASSPLSSPDANSPVSPSFSVPKKPRSHLLKFGNGIGNTGGKAGALHGNATTSSKTKIPTVQDLAIQPVQRVVRYVLLYKDLLNSTPDTSPSRTLVECALKGATRIAQRCNRAQDNAAFLL